MPVLRALARIWTAILACTTLALTLAVAARALTPLLPFTPGPGLLTAAPADGAADVPPRTPITLRFNTPMNRVTAAAALRIEPATPGSLNWSPDATSLTFQPTETLTPAVTYTVRLDSSALDRWWRPLTGPVTLQFRTATQPAVVAALPGGAGVAAESSLAVVFSQPMAPPATTGRPIELPQFSLTPPHPVTTRWLDQQTLLIRPAVPLAPATTYTATIAAELADLRGVELGAPFSWSFNTAWPALLEQSPADGARWVSPRAPLTLRLAAPVAPEHLKRALRIEPPVEGEFTSGLLGTTQVITFTPRAGWSYGTSYTVSLAGPDRAPWSFSVEPQPRLVAFFPGQGQSLPPTQAIRLVFSTPMSEEALRAGLRIEPPVADLPITINETEVRLQPELQPSTSYTITLAAGTLDRAGEPLAAEAVIDLRTAAPAPDLSAPQAFAGIVRLPLDTPAAVEFARVNLAAINLRLYSLDEPTLLRALALRPDEWQTFSPERYGQPLARGWRLDLADPPERPVRSAVPVGLADGEPLAPGAYFLRATSAEGPRADLVLLVTATRLTLRAGAGQALLWATDAVRGTPLADLPVALYRAGALVARGQTDADGLWTVPIAADSGPLLALATGNSLAVVHADWAPRPASPPTHSSLIFPDRLAYQPGETVTVTGLARRRDEAGQPVAPAADTPCRLQLRALSGSGSLAPPAPCAVSAVTGAISGTLTLPERLAPADYRLVAQLGDASSSTTLRVTPPVRAGALRLALSETGDGLRLAAEQSGLPLAGSTISWSLRLEPLAAPLPPAGFVLGPLPVAEVVQLAGQGTTSAEGSLLITPPELPAGTVRYRLRGEFTTPVGLSDSAEAEGLIIRGPPFVAVGLPSRIVAGDQRSVLSLLTLDGLGRPIANTRVMVEIVPSGRSADAPLLTRQATTGADGQATVPLVPITPGRYEVIATAGGAATRTQLWVVGRGFAGWRLPAGQLELVSDRDSYRPGEIATLLVATPAEQSTLLLIIERGAVLTATVQPLRAGQVITLPITADMAPWVNLSAVATRGEDWRWGTTHIRVQTPDTPPPIGIATDAASYLPGASATLTVTAGAGASFDHLLATIAPAANVADTGALSATALLERLRPAPLPPVVAATLPQPALDPPTTPRSASIPTTAAALSGELLTAPAGSDTLRVPLPDRSGRWVIGALAASGAGEPGSAATVISTSLPLEYDLLAPLALRASDRATLTLDLRNSGVGSREVQVQLSSTGLALEPAAARRQLSLAAGETQRLTWELAAGSGASRATLRLRITSADWSEVVSRMLVIEATHPAGASGRTLVGKGPQELTLTLPAGTNPVELALAPGVQAALEDQARQLAVLPERSVEQQASLALIATSLARTTQGSDRDGWTAMARAALAELDAAQNDDGGWGWWPGGPSRPFVSALVLEAQAVAHAAPGESRPPSLRAIAYLERAAAALGPDTRAYSAYVLALAGRAIPNAAALLETPLAADGLAFLAMALPPAEAAPAIERLLARAVREPPAAGQPGTVRWTERDPAELPRGEAAVIAAATQALRARQPTAAELPGAERALLAAWGVDGWASAYDAARVAAALLEPPAAGTSGPRRVTLDGMPLLGNSTPITTTLRTTLPEDRTSGPVTLRIEAASTSSYMVAYRAPGPPGDVTGPIALDQELVDPASGTPLAGERVRPGQLVGLRLTLVAAQPLLRADLELPLPAGLEPLPLVAQAPLLHVAGPTADKRRLLLHLGEVAPGIYSWTIVTRAVAPGSYSAPPAWIRATYTPALSASASAGSTITITGNDNE